MPIRVLIADDHQIVRSALRAVLETADDIRVITDVGTGDAAVKKTHELMPDVVVMDIEMPNLNGIDATRQISSGPFDSRVLCVSIHSDRRCVVAALLAGASGYLIKECSADELLRATRVVSQKMIYLSPAITGQLVKDYVHRMPEDESCTARLSDRERQILQMIAEGYSTREIAEDLYLSKKTVCTHREHIMKKLDISSVSEMTRYAVRERMTPLSVGKRTQRSKRAV
jgi:DNA-binding NarL/FixJ family response regulator